MKLVAFSETLERGRVAVFVHGRDVLVGDPDGSGLRLAPSGIAMRAQGIDVRLTRWEPVDPPRDFGTTPA